MQLSRRIPSSSRLPVKSLPGTGKTFVVDLAIRARKNTRWVADQLGHAEASTTLFWNPRATNEDKSFAYDAYLVAWYAACDKVGERIAPQAALRNSILSKLAEVLTPTALQAQSMHKDRRSLDHYTTGARPDPVAMVRAIRPDGSRGKP